MQDAQFQLHAEVEERHWWFTGRRKILNDVVRTLIPPPQPGLMLDVGCGTGANIAGFASDYRCLGIDTSEEAIRWAKSRFPQVEFVCGPAPAAIRERMAEVRLMTMTDVLEHVPDDFLLFSQLLAELPVGAYAVLTVPAERALWSPHDVAYAHYRRYSRERFRQIWTGLPVKEICLSAFNTRLYPLIKLVRRLNRRQGHAQGTAGTDVSVPPGPINAMLSRLFAGESKRVVDCVKGRSSGYRRGVSLIAVLQRQEGPMTPRTRPKDVECDMYDPAAGVYLKRRMRDEG